MAFGARGVGAIRQHAVGPQAQHGQVEKEEQVDRHRHQGAGFAQAAQIGQGDEGEQGEGDGDAVGPQLREGRGQRLDPRGEADRRGQQVADQQRRGGHQPGERAQVFPRHHVGAAAGGVGQDGLKVGEGHDDQQPGDCQANRPGQGQAGAARHEQAQVNFLVGVGDRGERVRRKCRQGADFIQLFFELEVGRKGWPNEEFFDLRQHVISIHRSIMNVNTGKARKRKLDADREACGFSSTRIFDPTPRPTTSGAPGCGPKNKVAEKVGAVLPHFR